MWISMDKLLLLCCAICVTSAQPCAEKMDVVLVIDSSGSIRDNNPPDGSYDNWQLIKDFLNDLVSLFVIGSDFVTVGAVVFSNDARVAFPLLQTESAIEDGIDNLPYLRANTNISGAIRVMTDMYTGPNHEGRFYTRPDARNVALLITDGYSTWDVNRTIPDAINAHTNGIELYTIGVTSLVDVVEVALMSSPPQRENETFWLLPSFQALSAVLEMIERRLCVGLPPISTTEAATPAPPLEGANPTAQELVQSEGFVAGMSVLGVFLTLLLIAVILIICCCCCCKTKCCAGLCTSCANTAYCDEHCACCSTPVQCCSLGTIFCCVCGGRLLAFLCCCCCWISGGKVRSKSCMSVTSSEDSIVPRPYTGSGNWNEKGDIVVTQEAQTPYTQIIHDGLDKPSKGGSDERTQNVTIIVQPDRDNMCERLTHEVTPEKPPRRGKKVIQVPIGPLGPTGNHTTIRYVTPPPSDIAPAHVDRRGPHHTFRQTRPTTTCCYDPNCYLGRGLTQCDFIGDCDVATGYGNCRSNTCNYDMHRSACHSDYGSYTGSYHGGHHGTMSTGLGRTQGGCTVCSLGIRQSCNYSGCQAGSYGCAQCSTLNTCQQCGMHTPTHGTTLPIGNTRSFLSHTYSGVHGRHAQRPTLNLTEIIDSDDLKVTRKRKDKKRHARRAETYRYDSESHPSASARERDGSHA